jgi:acetylornithine deacetylase/succinyl-diaminopimelate desuccinylase-like protein
MPDAPQPTAADHADLAQAVEELQPATRTELEQLVRIPSVSAEGPDTAAIRRAADHVADALAGIGLDSVRLLEVPGAPPAVTAEAPAPPGAPTVLLYAHYDVQPAFVADGWRSDPFEPVELDGRLYGRGASDDKAGVLAHLTALRAHDGRPPVGVRLFIEGEEELGSPHLDALLATHGDALAADVIFAADSEHWAVGQPAITTSLRGLVDCVVEVRVLEVGVHSGQFGGPLPDALSALAQLLATLQDADGHCLVEGLTSGSTDGPAVSYDEYREQAGVLPGIAIAGEDAPPSEGLASQLWMQPAVSVLAIDAPAVPDAVNQIVPAARAKVSLRLAPGEDPASAMTALVSHLERHAPDSAIVEVTPGASAAGYAADATGPAFDAYRSGCETAWGVSPMEIGIGGTIPFVAAFGEAFPSASIVLIGAGEPSSRIHGPNESQDLEELRRNSLAEAVALRTLGNAP